MPHALLHQLTLLQSLIVADQDIITAIAERLTVIRLHLATLIMDIADEKQGVSAKPHES